MSATGDDGVVASTDDDVTIEAARRRTFAIISHPDAGKTTLTEKLLLYADAINLAGSVRDRRDRRSTTSDWMEMEQRRGISITSTVLRFDHADNVVNLLDTPGHKDFSEDTYRVISACDSALMVIDAAKGIEAQTLKLFQISHARGIPLLTFVNKCDRPGPGPLGIIDEIEERIGVAPTPVTWPVGLGAEFVGVVDRRDRTLVRFTRSEHGATRAGEERVALSSWDDLAEFGDSGVQAAEELSLLDELGRDHDPELFLAGLTSPVFFGSALWNFGVGTVLDAVSAIAPAPRPLADADGAPRPLDAPCSGFVFKIQANMDRNHRDHVAFVRLCSGAFRRGMNLVHGPTGRTVSTKYAQDVFGQDRVTLDAAFPGDIVGLVNAPDVRIGDTLFESAPVVYPPIPTFAPELFMTARNLDTGRYKQFKRGLSQLDREGVVQVLRHPDLGDQAPVLAAVGSLQFEVASDRMANEFGAPVELSTSRYKESRRTDVASAAELRSIRGVDVLEKEDGTLFACFDSAWTLDRVVDEHPRLLLESIVAV